MKEESKGGWTPFVGSQCHDTSKKTLRKLEGLRICDKKKYKSRIKSIFRFQRKI